MPTDSSWNSVREQVKAWQAQLAGSLDELEKARTELEQVQSLKSQVESQEQVVRRELGQMELRALLVELEGELADLELPVRDVAGSVTTNLESLALALERRLKHTGQDFDSLTALCGQALRNLQHRQRLLTETMTRVTARRAESDVLADDHEETILFEPGGLAPDRLDDDSEPSGRDRRKFPRGALSAEVRLTGSDVSLRGATQNVSAGGLFFATDYPVELGRMVHVVCEISRGEAVRADGVVIWVRGGRPGVEAGIGVEFVAVLDDHKKRLETVLQEW